MPRLSGWPLLLDGHSARLRAASSARPAERSAGRLIGGHSAVVNVGDKVSACVVVPVPGAKGHVGRKARGRRQAGPLADQEDHDRRVEQLAQVVEHAHAAMTDEKRLAETPAARGRLRVQEGQERGHLRDDRGGRQAVADRDLDVGSGRAETLDLGLARLVERSTQVGSEQEFLLRCGLSCRPRTGPTVATNSGPRPVARSSSALTASRAAAWSRRSSSRVDVLYEPPTRPVRILRGRGRAGEIEKREVSTFDVPAGDRVVHARTPSSQRRIGATLTLSTDIRPTVS